MRERLMLRKTQMAIAMHRATALLAMPMATQTRTPYLLFSGFPLQVG